MCCTGDLKSFCNKNLPAGFGQIDSIPCTGKYTGLLERGTFIAMVAVKVFDVNNKYIFTGMQWNYEQL